MIVERFVECLYEVSYGGFCKSRLLLMVSGYVTVLSPRLDVSSGCGWSRRHSYIIVAANMYNESEIADKEWRLILGIKRWLIITHRQDLACCEMSGRGKSHFEESDEPLGCGRSGISCYQLNDFLLKIDGTSGGSSWWFCVVIGCCCFGMNYKETV